MLNTKEALEVLLNSWVDDHPKEKLPDGFLKDFPGYAASIMLDLIHSQFTDIYEEELETIAEEISPKKRRL